MSLSYISYFMHVYFDTILCMKSYVFESVKFSAEILVSSVNAIGLQLENTTEALTRSVS